MIFGLTYSDPVPREPRVYPIMQVRLMLYPFVENVIYVFCLLLCSLEYENTKFGIKILPSLL